MDNNIRLVSINRKQGIGKFNEVDKLGRKVRELIIPLSNMVGSGYQCQNLNMRKDGTIEFNGIQFASLQKLLAGEQIVANKVSKDLKKNSEETVKYIEPTRDSLTDEQIYVEHMKLLSNVIEVPTLDNKFIYINVDKELNVLVGVPSDVMDACSWATWAQSMNKRNGGNLRFKNIKFIGGGPNLHRLDKLLYNVKAESLDLTQLDISNVTSAKLMYDLSDLTYMDLSWTHRCKLKNIDMMFSDCYCKTTVPFNQMKLDYVKSMKGLFQNSTVDIDFGGMNPKCTPNLKVARNIFYRYENQKQHLWLKWMDVSNVEDMCDMFYMTKCNMVDISNWDVSKAKETVGMFEDIKTGVKGFCENEHENGGLYWDSLVQADRMFYGIYWNSTVVLHLKNKTLKQTDRMFTESTIKVLDIRDITLEHYQLALSEHMFTGTRGTLKLTVKQADILREKIAKKYCKMSIEKY